MVWPAGFLEGVPDARHQTIARSTSCGDVAVDEGFLVGRHTGRSLAPDGERIEPTGDAVRIRACDVMEVRDGAVASHRFDHGRMERLGRLGPGGAGADRLRIAAGPAGTCPAADAVDRPPRAS